MLLDLKRLFFFYINTTVVLIHDKENEMHFFKEVNHAFLFYGIYIYYQKSPYFRIKNYSNVICFKERCLEIRK